MKPVAKLIIFGTTLLTIALFLVSSAAMAQVPCGQRDSIVKWLAVKYKEAPIATGVSSKGSLIEVLSTLDGDTWTLIVTSPDGNSCMIASGQGWRARPHEVDIAEPQAYNLNVANWIARTLALADTLSVVRFRPLS